MTANRPTVALVGVTAALLCLLGLASSAATAADCDLSDLPCYPDQDGKGKCNIKFVNKTGLGADPYSDGRQIASAQDIRIAARSPQRKRVGGAHVINAGRTSTLNLTSDNKVEKGFDPIRIAATFTGESVKMSCSKMRKLFEAEGDDLPVCKVAIVNLYPCGVVSGCSKEAHVGYRCGNGVEGDSLDNCLGGCS